MSAAEHQGLKERPKCVLVVEDDFLTRWGIAEYLREIRYEVIEAVNAVEAKAILVAGTPVDAILCGLDLTLDQNGNEFSRSIEGRYPQIPILLSYSHPSAGTRFVASPTRDAVAKPYRVDDVEARLARLIAKS